MRYYSPTAFIILCVMLTGRLIKILSSRRYRIASSLVLVLIVFYSLYGAGIIGKSKVEAKSKTELINSDEPYYFDNGKEIIFFKIDGGFTIQTGSYKMQKTAEEKKSEFVKKHMPDVRVEEVINNNGKFYRVRIGKFKTLDEARDFADKNSKILN